MSCTVCFTKSSLPYNPGDVVTFSDIKGNELLRHPQNIVRKATRQDIEGVYTRLGQDVPGDLANALGEATLPSRKK